MIIYSPRGLSALLRFDGSVAQHIWGRVLLVVSIAILLTILRATNVVDLAIGELAHTYVGVVLGLVLLFRTNSCNEKYNEGRRLLGQINNSGRNLLRSSFVYITGDDIRAFELKNNIRRLSSALFYSVKHSLRKDFITEDFQGLLLGSELDLVHKSKAWPQCISMLLTNAIHQSHVENRLTAQHVFLMDGLITLMIDAWGGMQRIQGNMTPFAYAHHIKVFLYFYCLTVPFALLTIMGNVTPVATLFITYALFGIEEIGIEIEEPFGDDPNDLPFEDIVDKFAAISVETLQVYMYAKGKTIPGDQVELSPESLLDTDLADPALSPTRSRKTIRPELSSLAETHRSLTSTAIEDALEDWDIPSSSYALTPRSKVHTSGPSPKTARSFGVHFSPTIISQQQSAVQSPDSLPGSVPSPSNSRVSLLKA